MAALAFEIEHRALTEFAMAHSLSEAHANVLVRVLGREPEVDVDLSEVPVQPGDYVLLCSDGLTRMVPERVMAEAIVRLRHPQRICDHLIAAANSNGGTDNVTVVVIEVAGSRWARLVNGLKGSAGRGHVGQGMPPEALDAGSPPIDSGIPA